MMEILQHQQPHHQGFLQQDQSRFLVSDQRHQQFHQQTQPFQGQFQGPSESPSPSIASAPPLSSSQSIQQHLLQQKRQQEEDFKQQEAALNKLKDLFEQNDLNELISPPTQSKHEVGQGPYRDGPRIQRLQESPIYTFIRTTTISNKDSNKWGRNSQSAQERLEMLTTASLSLDALDPFMMDPSTVLFVPGSSATPPPSWLLESDLGVGLIDDPDDEEAETDTADDWSSTQADESGTSSTKGVRHVGGRAVGGSRPNSASSPKYECPLCSRFYTRPFNLRSHMLVHEDKKPFACELCDSRFTRRHDMVRHVKTRHKNHQQDVVGEGAEGGGPSLAPTTPSSAIPLEARSLEGRDEVARDTLEILQ
ncbi:hypothetical protein BG000_004770 [Podila horticola]|nr:hypothetical protein BG000_004770 [Podila horticola]